VFDCVDTFGVNEHGVRGSTDQYIINFARIGRYVSIYKYFRRLIPSDAGMALLDSGIVGELCSSETMNMYG